MEKRSTYINVADNNRVSVGIKKILAFRISSQNDGLSSISTGQCRVDELCKN